MLKQLGLKHRSHVHIALLISSILFIMSGCAMMGSGGVSADGFHPEYYAAKELTSDEVVKLRQYSSSMDTYVSDSATLILGKFYLTYGDINYGRLLINRVSSSVNLDPQMQIYGKLWMLDSYLADKRIDDAMALAKDIVSIPHDEVYLRTIKGYCNNKGFYVGIAGGIDSCIDAFSQQGSDEIEHLTGGIGEDARALDGTGADRMTYDEYLSMLGAGNTLNFTDGLAEEVIIPTITSNATLNIVAKSSTGDIENGLMFGIANTNAGYQVQSIAHDEEFDYTQDSVFIDIDTQSVTVSGLKTFFAADINKSLNIASTLEGLSKYNVIIVSVSGRKMQSAALLKSLLASVNNTASVTVLNHENPNYHVNLKNAMDKNEGKTLLNIGIGTEEELHDFISITRYLQSDATLQSILMVTDSFNRLDRYPRYSSYYRDVYVLSPIVTAEDFAFNGVDKAFEQFFGKPMNEGNMIGYDILVYLNHILSGDYGISVDGYLTDILGFYQGKPDREVKLYYINEQGEIVEPIGLKIVAPYIEEPVEEAPAQPISE